MDRLIFNCRDPPRDHACMTKLTLGDFSMIKNFFDIFGPQQPFLNVSYMRGNSPLFLGQERGWKE